MRPTTLLALSLLVVVAAGAAWLLLDAPPVAVETWDDDPLPGSTPDRPAEPPPTRPPVVVEPPVEVVPRVAVLGEGAELPPDGPADTSAWDALHESFLKGGPGGLSGTDLVQAVGKAAYLRFRSAADLEAVQRLDPDPEWSRDEEIPLLEVVEHWRRAGFEVEPRGQLLVVTRRDE